MLPVSTLIVGWYNIFTEKYNVRCCVSYNLVISFSQAAKKTSGKKDNGSITNGASHTNGVQQQNGHSEQKKHK